MPRGKQKNRERSKTISEIEFLSNPDNINKYKIIYKGKSRSSPDNKKIDTTIECINNNEIENGYITKRFSSGDRFEGNYIDGKRNGYGLYIWLNCDKYTGNWKNGFMDGYGWFAWATGDSFVGDWIKGKMNGNGVKINSNDGSRVEGSFMAGRVHGYAIKTYANGDIYRGNYNKDKRNGYGEYLWYDGISYIGNWKLDIMEGLGENNNNIKNNKNNKYDPVTSYQGNFHNNLRNGLGTAIMCDGSKYTGEWLDGVKNGWGKHEYVDGCIYEGNFINDKRQGEGMLKYPNDEIDIDENNLFDFNKIIFQVEIILSSRGGVYVGEFNNDFIHGDGLIIFPNGQEYQGEFNKGRNIKNIEVLLNK